MKKSNVALAIVLGTVGVLAIAAILGALGYILINGVSKRPSTEEEKKLVVDAAALIEFGAEVDPKCGTYTTTRNFDSSVEISYECDSDTLYVLATTEISPTARDARQMFVLNIGAHKVVTIGGDDITMHRRDDLVANLGDDRYAAIIRSGATEAGNVFIIRQGRVVQSVMITGLAFDDADSVRDLLTPIVDAARTHATRKKKQ